MNSLLVMKIVNNGNKGSVQNMGAILFKISEKRRAINKLYILWGEE
jgi:hypothetical protein